MEKITSRENAKDQICLPPCFQRGVPAQSRGNFWPRAASSARSFAAARRWRPCSAPRQRWKSARSLPALPGEHYLVEDHVADKLADVGTHQGRVRRLPHPGAHAGRGAKTGGRYLALERVQDPGNVGTLLRSAAAFGFDGVLLSDGCASVFAPKTLRASMGAAVRVPVMEVGAMPAAIAALRAKNITCLAAALYQSQPLSAARPGYPGGVCVVIGSEGQGLTEETIAACSGTVRIPMTDRVESLNAGIAGSILLWHFREESL